MLSWFTIYSMYIASIERVQPKVLKFVYYYKKIGRYPEQKTDYSVLLQKLTIQYYFKN